MPISVAAVTVTGRGLKRFAAHIKQLSTSFSFIFTIPSPSVDYAKCFRPNLETSVIWRKVTLGQWVNR